MMHVKHKGMIGTEAWRPTLVQLRLIPSQASATLQQCWYLMRLQSALQ